MNKEFINDYDFDVAQTIKDNLTKAELKIIKDKKISNKKFATIINIYVKLFCAKNNLNPSCELREALEILISEE